jgi:hypothetical protein
MAKTRGKPRKDRKYPTAMAGIHRAYYVKGTDTLAHQIRNGSSGCMEWRDGEGNPCEVQLKSTGKPCAEQVR